MFWTAPDRDDFLYRVAMRTLLGLLWFVVGGLAILRTWAGSTTKIRMAYLILTIWIPVQLLLGGYGFYNKSRIEKTKEEAIQLELRRLFQNPGFLQSVSLCWLWENSSMLPDSRTIEGWITRNYDLTDSTCSTSPLPDLLND